MKKTVLYEEALVTYLNILGFRELVQTESAGRISRTIRLVRDALKPSHDRAKLYEMTYQSFSDLTVVSIPVLTSANLEEMQFRFNRGDVPICLLMLCGTWSLLIP